MENQLPVASSQLPDGKTDVRLGEFERRLIANKWQIDYRVPKSNDEHLGWVTCWKRGADRFVIETDSNGEFKIYVESAIASTLARS